MTKRRDVLTGDLFDWEPPQVAVGYSEEVTGRGGLDSKISRAIGKALRDARDDGAGDRAALAARMSQELGRRISTDMLNKWSSESSGEHRIPLDAFIALIRATDATDLLGLIPALFGFAVVPERYATIIEMHLLDEHERDIVARRAALQARWRGAR